MKTTRYLLASLLLLLATTTASAQTTAGTWATTDNVRTVVGVGRDIKGKKYDRAATKVLNHREVKRRVKLSDREAELLKNPRASASSFRRDPLSFAEKHKSSFWDRFRKQKKGGKKTTTPTKKK